MWTLTVRSPDSKPSEYLLKPGVNTVGRRGDNDVVISDEAASRRHAEITLDEAGDSLTVRDLRSSNGTFINRRRLTEDFDFPLQPNDVVRIGLYELLVTQRSNSGEREVAASGFQPFNRELLLESIENHAVTLYEVMQRLNDVMDLDTAVKEVGRLLQVMLGADKCQVVLAEDFGRLEEMGLPRSLADAAIGQQSTVLVPNRQPETEGLISESMRMLKVHTALCVPVVAQDKTIALVYVMKSRTDTRLFNQRDMQMAVAVSHLAAQTIERVTLIERKNQDSGMRRLLQRFVAPVEAEVLLGQYAETGKLPSLRKQRCTVLYVDTRGASELAEQLAPEEFGELLGRYYQDISNVVFQYGGMLVNCSGAGAMAIFGMSKAARTKPAINAVAAGQEILRVLAALYTQPTNKLEAGIGINTGMMTVGIVSTRERVELTVMGGAVEEGAWMQYQAKNGQILVGEATAADIKGKFSVKPASAAVGEAGELQPVYEITE